MPAISDPVLVEKLSVLDGSSNRNAIGRAAVRLQDLDDLLSVELTQQSRTLPGPDVTVDDFNALVDDVGRMMTALRAVAAALQRRRAPT